MPKAIRRMDLVERLFEASTLRLNRRGVMIDPVERLCEASTLRMQRGGDAPDREDNPTNPLNPST
jgi:hypothetical protein